MSDNMARTVRARHTPNPGGRCRACRGAGTWETECCNGAYGCTCMGQPINMGACRVCGGTGVEPEGADPAANLAAISGYGYIGSGPRESTAFDGLPRMGHV